jgi:hypothetical protein
MYLSTCDKGVFSLTYFHKDDAESRMTNAEVDFDKEVTISLKRLVFPHKTAYLNSPSIFGPFHEPHIRFALNSIHNYSPLRASFGSSSILA